ncbi:MAG: DUF3387 domain-containing protein [Methylococcaceae bacterium]|nr:DUF3387 domain-containing protein [Methylococcaceae bacterium]
MYGIVFAITHHFLSAFCEIPKNLMISVDITEKLRASATVDWQVREGIRARLRILVRRTLQKWKYPPPGPGEKDAVELVLLTGGGVVE